MKAKFIFTVVLLVLFSSAISLADNNYREYQTGKVSNLTFKDWETLGTNNDYWLNKVGCFEDKKVYNYLDKPYLYLDNFRNTGKNGVNLYLWGLKTVTTGKYFKYNISHHIDNGKKYSGLLIWNKPYISKDKSRTVKPDEKIRHATTAEEVKNAGGNAWFAENRSMNPYMGGAGKNLTDSSQVKEFKVPNYRSDGTHPDKPTMFPNFDAEIRTITFYTTNQDGKLDTTKNNIAIVECQKNVIRWCGDGIFDDFAKENGEACDPKDPAWKGKCTRDCQRIPECKSSYNGQELESLSPSRDLCKVGIVSEFKLDKETHTWTWKCNGVTGTTPAQCTAKQKIEPACKYIASSPIRLQISPKDYGLTKLQNDYAKCSSKNNVADNAITRQKVIRTGVNNNILKWECVFLETIGGTPKPSKTDRCELEYIRCGDGIFQPDKEQCDPKDPEKKNWGDKICNNQCTLENKPIPDPECRTPNGELRYFLGSYTGGKYPTWAEWNISNEQLCKEGILSYTPTYNTDSKQWEWKCVNEARPPKETDICWVKAERCGDGILQSTKEDCDPEHPNWKGKNTCNSQCKTVKPESPQCHSDYNGKTLDSLTEGNHLCSKGTVGNFTSTATGWTWMCNGVAGTTPAQCSANKKNSPVNRYDLALTKKVADPAKIYNPGDQVEFIITLYNQGNVSAKNITITEYIPEGLELVGGPNWIKQANLATFKYTAELQPDQRTTIQLLMKIKSDFKGDKIINTAEISKDNAGDYGTTDKDSTPDTNPDNDCIVGEDKHYITGNGKAGGVCSPETDEDDHDRVTIHIKQPEPSDKPTIQKELLGAKEHRYASGDLVGFKMPFGNTGAKTIFNVKIRDILPLNLEYVSSEIHGVQPVTSGLYLNGGVQVLEYSGFTLAAGQTGHLVMTGRVLPTYTYARKNAVFIYVNNTKVDWAEADYLLATGIKIDKTVDKKIVKLGDEVEFTIKVVNNGLQKTIKKMTVKDFLPKGLEFLTGTRKLIPVQGDVRLKSFKTESATTGTVLVWDLVFDPSFKDKDELKISFKAKVTAKSGTETNEACVFPPDDPKVCDKEDVNITGAIPDKELTIQKYVGTTTGSASSSTLRIGNGSEVYFKLIVSNPKRAFTGFTIKDTIEGNLIFDTGSWNLPNNQFTGKIFSGGTEKKPSNLYTITPQVNGTHPAHIEWKVEMKNGAVFTGGDTLVLFIKAKKIKDSQINTGFVHFLKEDGTADSAYATAEVIGSVPPPPIDNCGDGKEQVPEECDLERDGEVVRDGKLFSKDGKRDSAYNGYTCRSCKLYDVPPPPPPIDNCGDGIKQASEQCDLIYDKEIKNGRLFERESWIDHTYNGYTCESCKLIKKPGPGPIPSSYCGDGQEGAYEVCDLGRDGEIVRDGKLFSRGGTTNPAYNGYTCKACKLYKSGEKGEIISPQCFNIQNGSISIMKGELLPFYRNLEAMSKIKSIETKSEKDKVEMIKNNFAWSCNSEKDNDKIELKSMQCTFAVYGPSNTTFQGNKIYEFNAPCVSVNGWSPNNSNTLHPLIKSFIDQNKHGWFGGSVLDGNPFEVKNTFDSLDNWNYPTLLPLSSKLLIRDFGGTHPAIWNGNTFERIESKGSQYLGEYKLALEKITYNTCQCSIDTKSKKVSCGKKETSDDRVCEVDFTVTEPYLIQKSPYGIGNKATTNLNNYKLKNGKSFMETFFPTEQTSETAYETPKNMKSLFTKFKNKYQKLAKPLGNNGLSKVPGKSIYFYNGNQELTSLLNSTITSKPFTLIASKGQNLTIKGNLLTNAMIMTEGTITFDAGGSCNGDSKTYGHAGQIVQGIFYAGGGFKSSNHENLKNTFDKLSKNERCNYGNLHIKGVAIGDLTEVVKNRRSELYTWFSANSKDGTHAKKDIIINGASVLIEYNPNLRGHLPPGAEEFNKALSVYRK